MQKPVSRIILNGWKQIARHIDRGVRTAQRWEALLGMPVHRPAGKDRSAVLAFSDELESWLGRTSPSERDACDTRAAESGNQQRLLRALDNMHTLVQQSSDLLHQVKILEEQLRLSRKARRIILRSRARAAAGLRRNAACAFAVRRSGPIAHARGLR